MVVMMRMSETLRTRNVDEDGGKDESKVDELHDDRG